MKLLSLTDDKRESVKEMTYVPERADLFDKLSIKYDNNDFAADYEEVSNTVFFYYFYYYFCMKLHSL